MVMISVEIKGETRIYYCALCLESVSTIEENGFVMILCKKAQCALITATRQSEDITPFHRPLMLALFSSFSTQFLQLLVVLLLVARKAHCGILQQRFIPTNHCGENI